MNPETAGIVAQVASKALGREPSKGTMLAVAILLFWLAGVLFFVAFEGSGFLGENVPAAGATGGASYVKAIIQSITAKAAAQAQQGAQPAQGG